MQINYIILTHKSPTQLERLISRLDDEDVKFFVHIDAKANIEPFKYLQKENVVFLNDRVDVIWGDYSIVQATLNAMQCVVEHSNGGYTILLSGQDYPIKSKTAIKEYLSKNQNFDFIEFTRVEERWKRYRERTVARKINFSSKKGRFAVIFSIFDINIFKPQEVAIYCYNLLKFLYFSPFKNYGKLFSILFKKTKNPFSAQYGGSAWWAFRHCTVTKILELIAQRKEFVEYHKVSLLPDEMFFQTLISLIDNPEKQIKPTITYANWGKKAKSPLTFDERNFEELSQQPENMLFARKFDTEPILDMIDNFITVR